MFMVAGLLIFEGLVSPMSSKPGYVRLYISIVRRRRIHDKILRLRSVFRPQVGCDQEKRTIDLASKQSESKLHY
jgi:hypothetical protein